MVDTQISQRGITDDLVLDAFTAVPRELFVPEAHRHSSYEDRPLPIGREQTISQPFIVALMLEALHVRPGDRVLDVGTGSGYQAALMAVMGAEVFSVERIPLLARRARRTIVSLGLDVKIAVKDGTLGWPEKAPFNKIIIGAAAPDIPHPLLMQLAPGGVMVLPVGDMVHQSLVRIKKQGKGEYQRESLGGCVFVPLVGKYGWREDKGNNR